MELNSGRKLKCTCEEKYAFIQSRIQEILADKWMRAPTLAKEIGVSQSDVLSVMAIMPDLMEDDDGFITLSWGN